jgi:hypothetical protein
MAKTSLFGFTNITANAVKLSPIDLKLVSNYARIDNEAQTCVLSNKTTPLDIGELVTYRANDLDKVTSTQQIQNPAPVRNGIQYVIKVEDILRTVDANGAVICDEPIVAYLTIRHQKSGNVTPAHIEAITSRVIGACQRSNGTYRFDDLMRSALAPIAD